MPKPGDATLTDARLRALYNYWVKKRGDRKMPARADIDPTEIPDLLPIIGLVDVVDGGARYRYRLLGTEIVQTAGCDSTGRYADEILPTGCYADHILGLLREVTRERRPLYSDCRYEGDNGVARQIRRLILPLSGDGSTVDMTFTGQVTVVDKNSELPHGRQLGPMNEITRVLLD